MRNVDLEVRLIDNMHPVRARYVTRQIARSLPMSRLAGIVYTEGALGALSYEYENPGLAGAASGVASGASMGSAFGPIGTAVGAVIGGIFGGSHADVAAIKADVASRTGLADQWRTIAGTLPGRQIGWTNLRQIWMGLNHQGLFPKNAKRGPGGVPGEESWISAWMDQRSEKGASVPEVVAAALAKGIDNPVQIADTMWNAAQPKNNLWAQFANPTERQLIIDLLDAKIAQSRPSSPLYYAKPAPSPVATPSAPNIAKAQEVVKDLITSGTLPVSSAGITPTAATAAIVQSQLQAQGVPADQAAPLAQSIAVTGLQPVPAQSIIYPPSTIMAPASSAPDSAVNPPVANTTQAAVAPATAGFNLPAYWPWLAAAGGAYLFLRSRRRR